MTLVARALPTDTDVARWRQADTEARPRRLAALRSKMDTDGVGAYFGVRRESIRYLTGMEYGEGEEKVGGNSGQFLVGRDEIVVLADSRYYIQVVEECVGARMEKVYNDLYSRWPALLESLGSPKRVAVEAGFVSKLMWDRLAAAAPDVELVAAENWVETLRQVKEPAEIERVAAACAVADFALERVAKTLRVGMTESEIALALEWEMRTNGAEGLAFPPAVLSGPRAALPHGSPGARRVAAGEVLLFDFGAQVCGYRSDTTRTLFVGEPSARDRAIYDLVARAQTAPIDVLAAAVTVGGPLPSGRALDKVARDIIGAAGHGDHFGHGLGHGIGLATHEMPNLGLNAADTPLPTPTVFTSEPGVYLEGEMGVRIEDVVLLDAAAGRVERLSRFPREVTVVGE
jgi:Xaa-Pro aminopeptidase